MLGWQARPCMNLHGLYRWFGMVPQGLVLSHPFSFLVIFGALSCDSLGGVLRVFSCGIYVGCHICGPCASLTLDSTSIWWFFRVARVLDLEGLNPRFPLIVGVSVRFLCGRDCPRGNPAIPEVSPQSVGWIGRSGDGKLSVNPRPVFWVGRSNHHRGRSNRPGSSSLNFWLCRIFLYEFVRLDQRNIQVKPWLVSVLFARSSCLEFVAGYKTVDGEFSST
jgi:hypothetical protein